MSTWGWPQAATSGSGITITTSGTTSIPVNIPYVALGPVASPYSERNLREDRRLTAVEWLRQQVDDVCLRAVMA